MPIPSRRPLTLCCALAITLSAAAVRAARLRQSLWLDEMMTLDYFVRAPWHKVLAGGAGEYVPNNHVLHTALAKLAYAAFGPAGEGPVREWALRLPSWAAASLLPVAVAWPLRRRSPLAAVAVGVVLAVHPWLVALGSEARGYSIMLLLGVVATHLLPRPGERWPRLAGYALALAGAIYTVPLAVLLVPAHAVAVVAGRLDRRRWAAGVALAGVACVGLYAPMRAGLAAYYRDPEPVTMDYRGFVDALPRHAAAGERCPRRVTGPATAAESVALTWGVALAVVAGTVVGLRRFPDARPLLLTLATVTALGVALPLAVPSATEVRFVTWAAPCLGLSVVLLLAWRPWTTVGGVVAVLVPLAWWDARQLPNQPVREGLVCAEAHAPAESQIVVAYLGADVTFACYGDTSDRLVPVDDEDTLRRQVPPPDERGGPLPWVVVIFEPLARDRAPTDPWAATVCRTLDENYRLVQRFPGRIEPVEVYAPRAVAGE